MPSRTPRCAVCEKPKPFCVCSALQLWQAMEGLPRVVIPFVPQKPTGAREIGFPFPERRRGTGKKDPPRIDGVGDPPNSWLPSLAEEVNQGKHYGKESMFLRTVIYVAHHDPPMRPDPEKPEKLIVNHQPVINLLEYLIAHKCDINAEYVDPDTQRPWSRFRAPCATLTPLVGSEWRPHCTTRPHSRRNTRKVTSAASHVPLFKYIDSTK